jgi:hypothetical protein
MILVVRDDWHKRARRRWMVVMVVKVAWLMIVMVEARDLSS